MSAFFFFFPRKLGQLPTFSMQAYPIMESVSILGLDSDSMLRSLSQLDGGLFIFFGPPGMDEQDGW